MTQMYNNNPYNISAMQNQLAQLQSMQNQIQSPFMNFPQQQPSNGVVQFGSFVVVKTVQDMENYPAPINGTPVNIFIEGKGIFYSKKMANGTTSCQPFTFAPLNNAPVNPIEEECCCEVSLDSEILKQLRDISGRLDKLEGVKNEQ